MSQFCKINYNILFVFTLSEQQQTDRAGHPHASPLNVEKQAHESNADSCFITWDSLGKTHLLFLIKKKRKNSDIRSVGMYTRSICIFSPGQKSDVKLVNPYLTCCSNAYKRYKFDCY